MKQFFENSLRLFSGLRKYEKLTCLYVGLTALLALFASHRIENWQYILIYHIVLIGGILSINYFPIGQTTLAKIVKDWYIFILFPFLFKELTFLSRALFPYYLEPLLVASERYFISVYHGYIHFFRETAWTTELMAMAYSSYYFIIPAVGIYIYKNLSDEEFEFYVFKFCVTMLFSYIFFILVPVRGPHNSILQAHPENLRGGLFFRFILLMQHYGSAVGAAFPSSHVAAAWISAYSLKRVKIQSYYAILPLMILLTISVFYLRYHYVLDAVFGYFLALSLEYYFEKKAVPYKKVVLNKSFIELPSKIEP